jgi:GNAT superfamily N-acetyltransferase
MITMIAEKVNLPEGFTAHPPAFADLPALIALFNTCSRHLLGVEKFRVQDLESEWMLPNYGPATHTMVVWDAQGNPVGYIELWDIMRPLVVFNCWERVHPNYAGATIEAFLLDWAERRARQVLDQAPQGARLVLRSGAPALDQAMQASHQQAGFSIIRHFWRMVIDLEQAPPPAQLHNGLTMRTMRAGEERLAIQAFRTAFHDHWGHVDTSFEEEFERWQHFMSHDEEFDPSLWFMAMDGEQIAGFSYCRNKVSDDPEMGWVGQLGVLRPWRKQGLGLALLQHSFGEFYRRGKLRAGLGVDAQNLTGAMRLYEKAGMHPDPRHAMVLFEKELRPGYDLSTQTVEA